MKTLFSKIIQKINMINQSIYNFMEDRVAQDTSYDFKKLFSKFWFLLYYLLGYPLRILGLALDGFVIYGLVYSARGIEWQAWIIAIIGASLIQVMLGLSTSVSAKNLFRGLLFRSVAYAAMFVITAFFAGGSLYSTLYLSKKGSAFAVEAVSPTLQQTSLKDGQRYNDKRIQELQLTQKEELQDLKIGNKEAQEQLTKQIAAAKQTIKEYQKKVNTYEEDETVPWEYREPIIKSQRQVDALQTKLAKLIEQQQKDAAGLRQQHSKMLTLAEQSKLSDVASTKATNQHKAQKLEVYGMIAVGGNVGINLISFFIILGYELYIKFAEGNGELLPPRKRKQPIDDEKAAEEDIPTTTTDSTPNQKTEHEPNNQTKHTTEKTITKNRTNHTKKVEIGVPQATQQPVDEVSTTEKEKSTQKTATVVKLKTAYFPYENHTKNARINFGRAFKKAKTTQTTLSRIKKAKKHINILLAHGFHVSQGEVDKTKLLIDKLRQPTLEKNSWECSIEFEKDNRPVLRINRIITSKSKVG